MSLKKFIIISLFFTLQFPLLKAQDNNPSILNGIKALLLTQESDWNKGDLQAYMNTYWHSDSLRFITKKGVTFGWQNMFDKYKKSYPDRITMGTLKFDILSIEFLSNDTVLMVGKWHVLNEKDNPSGYFSLLWKKISGSWKIVIDHTS